MLNAISACPFGTFTLIPLGMKQDSPGNNTIVSKSSGTKKSIPALSEVPLTGLFTFFTFSYFSESEK